MIKYPKKECIAMLLAGGRGSRLKSLTEHNAKPAVPFGGKYRIIDFPLSNCIHSGIDTVGVLTQYQPLQLNEYIGNGQPWDLDRERGGLTVLPPYQGKKGADWYKGTANAVYQNLQFIDRYAPDHVLILSGDHIYKMDYSKMLTYHREKNADCTIAVIDVPIEQAGRFGIMNLERDGGGRIASFEEKPRHPHSTTASMGIYIFNTDILRQYLTRDASDRTSSNDFGKNIIPAMLADGASLYAYRFAGYWRDVGTISSFWSANMDLLGEHPAFSVNDRTFRIFSRNYAQPPHFIGDSAVLHDSIVTEGCEIYGTVENSVLFNGVYVAPGAAVRDSVIFGGSRIGTDAAVDYAIVTENVSIADGVHVGEVRREGAEPTVIDRSVQAPLLPQEDPKYINGIQQEEILQ